MRRRLVVLLLLAALPVAAQELTIFDLNDFVDPRELGAAPSSTGGFLCPCSDLLIGRGIVGWDRNFVNIMQPTRLHIGFAHLATAYYRAPFQFNAKATVVRDVTERPDGVTSVPARAVPLESLALQAALYRSGGVEDNASASRIQQTWRITHYEEPARAEPRRFRDVIHHEFGAEYDLRIRKRVIGSLTYTSVPGDRFERSTFSGTQSRLAYVQRVGTFDLGPFVFEPIVTAGILGRGFDFGDLNRLTFQPSLRAAVPLWPRRVNLNVRYAHTWQRLGPRPEIPATTPLPKYEWAETPELAIFLDGVVFHRAFFRPR